MGDFRYTEEEIEAIINCAGPITDQMDFDSRGHSAPYARRDRPSHVMQEMLPAPAICPAARGDEAILVRPRWVVA